jgi:tRNA threonylcarbamoyl adenosine modification protein YjeE
VNLESASLRDLSAFCAAARAFAAGLAPGDVIALEGELGAGKTTFVAAAVRALHGREEASSPTFIFRHTYAGVPPVEHLDLYRIDDPAEAVELGLEDALRPDAVTFVEWPRRLPGLIPPGAIWVSIAGCGDGPRELEIRRGENGAG